MPGTERHVSTHNFVKNLLSGRCAWLLWNLQIWWGQTQGLSRAFAPEGMAVAVMAKVGPFPRQSSCVTSGGT